MWEKVFLVLCLCEVSVCEKYSWRKNLGFYDCVKGLCVRMMRLCARTNNKYGSTILALTWDAMTITSSHIISSSRLLLGFLICMLCSRLLCYVFVQIKIQMQISWVGWSTTCYEDGSTPFGSNTTCYPHEQELLHICVGYFVPKGREDRSQETQRTSSYIVDFWYSIFIFQKTFFSSF